MKGKERGVGKGPEKKGRKGRAQTSGTDASVVRGPWGRDEDEIVLSEVIKHGTNNVNQAQVAEKIPGRIGKQVRERWFNQLDPSLVWTEFTRRRTHSSLHCIASLEISGSKFQISCQGGVRIKSKTDSIRPSSN